MEEEQNSPTNNEQVFRDYRLGLYQEELGTVDLQFEDKSSDSREIIPRSLILIAHRMFE